VLVELDAAPGSAQRVLSSRARARCVAFDDGSGAVVTGAPVREAIATLDRSPAALARRRRDVEPPLDDARSVVVVMTGSLGSKTVNTAVLELARLWATRVDRAILHVTGRRDFAWVSAERPATQGLDYRVEAFADMTLLWGLGDAAVCRAGATTVAELTALGIPSVLVPLPGAPGDHQSLNARALASKDAAVVVRDAECTGEALAAALDDLLEGGRAAAVGAAARSLGHADAAGLIAEAVLRVAGRA
jgi:UDP-N-acetylglucosamine--N-acetylmuramyl-(pentapeptide) pyrophosphoryl-undecaprenol N-acetylglucosamine transferase